MGWQILEWYGHIIRDKGEPVIGIMDEEIRCEAVDIAEKSRSYMNEVIRRCQPRW